MTGMFGSTGRGAPITCGAIAVIVMIFPSVVFISNNTIPEDFHDVNLFAQYLSVARCPRLNHEENAESHHSYQPQQAGRQSGGRGLLDQAMYVSGSRPYINYSIYHQKQQGGQRYASPLIVPMSALDGRENVHSLVTYVGGHWHQNAAHAPLSLVVASSFDVMVVEVNNGLQRAPLRILDVLEVGLVRSNAPDRVLLVECLGQRDALVLLARNQFTLKLNRWHQ